MKRILKIAGICFLGLVGFWLAFNLFGKPYLRCWELRNSIFTALDKALSVKIIEHSCREDNPVSLYDPNYKDIIYSTITLTPQQIDLLQKSLPETTDISETIATSCIFEEHHRIEIVERDGSIFNLRLCFHCGELEVNNEGQRIMPLGWPSKLGSFVSSLGLHPKGPWK